MASMGRTFGADLGRPTFGVPSGRCAIGTSQLRTDHRAMGMCLGWSARNPGRWQAGRLTVLIIMALRFKSANFVSGSLFGKKFPRANLQGMNNGVVPKFP